MQLIEPVLAYLTLVLFIRTGFSYTANEAYDIGNYDETFSFGGDGTFDDKEQTKVVYEVVSDVY